MGKAPKNKIKAGEMKKMGPIVGPMKHQLSNMCSEILYYDINLIGSH